MRNHFLRAGGIPSSGGGGGGSSDTVTLATGSPFTKLVQINTGAGDTALNHTFSFDLEDVPTVPKAGKRVSIIHFVFRLAGNNTIANYTNWFKPSNQSGSAAFTIGGATPTLVGSHYSKFNGVATYNLTSDLNTSGSDADVSFSWNNSSFSPSGTGSCNGDGGYAVLVWIFDYVETMSPHTQYGYTNTGSTVTSFTVDEAVGGTGSGWTASFKALTGVSSNPNNDVNPHWTKDSADTSTYTVGLEGDNGTNEVSETSYSFSATGSPSNIKGTMGLDSGGVSTHYAGLAVITTNVRFKPSSS